MLDLGGVSPADTNVRINLGKNNKVRAVALDFHLITRSIEERRRMADEEAAVSRSGNSQETIKNSVVSPSASAIQPDINLVEQLASILNVKLGGETSKSKQSEKRIWDQSPRSS
jgi:ribosome-binding protein aMBF1 (putative translation factor)